METFEKAREYAGSFQADVDESLHSQGERELRSLALLRDAVEVEIASRMRELVAFEGLSWSAVAAAIAPSAVLPRERYGCVSREWGSTPS